MSDATNEALGSSVEPSVEQLVEESESDAVIREATESEYRWGFVTDIEADSLPRGLTEETVRQISARKDEPEFMLEWRLRAFEHWQKMAEPD